MEAFEQFVALAMETEGLVVSGALKFPVTVRTRKAAYVEKQTHGFEVDLIGARRDRLVLATVKSFFGSRGVTFDAVSGEGVNAAWYALLNRIDVRDTVVRLAAARFGYEAEQVEMRLYAGKFAGGGHEERIRVWAKEQLVGGSEIKVVGAHEVVSTVRQVAAAKTYRDHPVLATLKVLDSTGSLLPS